MRIALGNSDTCNVEGYATVEDVIKISYSQISKYEKQHLASQWLTSRYERREFLYGYILKDVKKEPNPFPYPKSASISSTLKRKAPRKGYCSFDAARSTTLF